MPRHAGNGSAVYRDFAGIRVIKAHQQIDQSGFSASRWAYDRDLFTRRGVKGKVFNQPVRFIIGKGYAAERDFSLRGGQFGEIPVTALRRLVDQFEQACGTGKSILQFGDHTGYFVKWLGILGGISQKTDKHTDRDVIAQCKKRPHQADHGINNIVDKPCGRVGERREENRF